MRQRAFTLIELLVSLSVLLVVIIATSRIFGTTGKVAAIGEASADLQATATAVEKVIRSDIERIAQFNAWRFAMM
jgi:prepilin-type N-terminal cleavage/methylation domain-containing protein